MIPSLFSICLLLVLAVSAPSFSQLRADPPGITPHGSVDFTGTLQVTFERPGTGNIHYTLDGANPTLLSPMFDRSENGGYIDIDRSLTLKAVRYQGLAVSAVDSAKFIRAKAPVPTARYGGNANYYPSVLCTLKTADNLAAIRYSLDGTDPAVNGLRYTAPISISANTATTLRALATRTGYDDSDPLKIVFTKTPPPETPVATPGTQSFSSASLIVKLKTSTPGAVIRWSVNPSASLDTAALLGDSLLTIQGGEAGDAVTLRAQAFKTGYPSSAIMTAIYTYLPQVEAPVASRAPGYFYDSAVVALTSATPGAVIRYTTDGSAPTASNSLEYKEPIHLSETATLRAFASKPPQPQSQVFQGKYDLRLQRPHISPSSRQYMDSLVVAIGSNCKGASLLFTLDGSMPGPQSALVGQNATLTLSQKDTTILTVIAVKGSVTSEPSREYYVKTEAISSLAAPIAEPSSREFVDTLRIVLKKADPSASVIRYTLDASEPTTASPRYDSAILIDSTAVLKAKAFPAAGAAGLEASPVRLERYVLTPSPPIPDPSPAGRYPDSVRITLRTGTRNGVIRYALGSDSVNPASSPVYKSGNPITLLKSTRLQAVTVLGSGANQRVSAPLIANYEIYAGVATDTLRPGAVKLLPGSHAFTNAGDAKVLAILTTTDTLGLVGFKDAGMAIILETLAPGLGLKVTYSKPADQSGSLYRVSGGIVEFISSDTRSDLTAPGAYFVGIDTLPPSIVLLSQTLATGDSTTLAFSVKDNVANPSCEIRSPGLPLGKVILLPGADGRIALSLKNPETETKGLWFRGTAKDFYNTGRLPADPTGKYFLARYWSALKSPAVLNLGRSKYPWDLGGLPVSASAPMRWGAVLRDNPASDLEALVWNEPLGRYVFLEDSSMIKPGMGFWIGSTSPQASLGLSDFRAGESDSDGVFRMTLRPGWNQVSSPSLEAMYWPVSPSDARYTQSFLKGLYRFDPDSHEYQRSDSLEPWKGYFAYYHGGRDTVITLLTDPSKRPFAKTSANQAATAVGEGAWISLRFGSSLPLHLGARIQAEDGVAREDEPELPSWNRTNALWAQRGSRHLATDVVRFIPGALLRWTVVIRNPSAARMESGGIGIAQGEVPAGYQVWALSSARKMKFRLEEGGELPLSGLPGDTLSILAGPLAKLSENPEFAKTALTVERFAFSLEPGPDGARLRLELPWPARVDADIRSATGRLLAESHPGRLGQGIYHLPLRGKGPSQMGFLRIRLNGVNGLREFSRKVVW